MVRLGIPERLKPGSKSGSRSSSPAGRAKDCSLILQTSVIRARDLAPKDKSGTSDPYLVITLASARSVTHAVPKSLNPEWNISFELPIAGPQSLLLECVCWDKDKFGKDYMGEFEVALEDIFANGKAVQESNWYKLRSKRQDGKIKDTLVSGAVELAFSLSDSANPQASSEALIQKFQALINSTSVEDEDSNLGRFEGTETNDYDDDDDTKDGSDQPEDPTKPETAEKKKRRLRIRRLKSERRPYEFNQLSDVIGVVYLEICKIVDLPPEKNMTRTGFDMDPFVVSSLGQKTYRTRVIRHNLNPVFEEKLVFQVLRHEQNYSINFAVIDRDKLSGNDFVAQVNFPLSDIISLSPEPDHETGLYRLRPLTDSPVQQPTKSRFRLPISRSSSAQNLTKVRSHSPVPTKGSGNLLATEPDRTPASATLSTVNGGSQDGVQSNGVDTNRQLAVDHNDDLKTFNIPLLLKNQERCESKHSPELIIRSKYVTYAALRQQFWRVILRQYDNDNTGHISKIELSTMLDTLGSTLKESTIDSWFQRFAPDGGVDGVLTVDQTVIALEEQLQKQSTSQKKSMGDQLKAKLHHTIHRNHSGSSLNQDAGAQDPAAPDAITNHVSTIQLDEHGQDGADGKTLPTDDMNDNGQERVVVISECPLCHQPRMSNKTDADMITHIATCASQDWRAVNNIVMGDFVTSSQAQRKWYSKVVNKVGFGGYKIGANSANTLVQDRLTGQINEERMSVYVRLGIRLLYKGLGAKDMEMKRIRRMLKSMSVKQGIKFDDPNSAKQIPQFIAFHQLNMDEVLLPIDQYKNFNEFFYRQLKPDARPCSAPNNPKIVVSPADSRSVVFNTISQAQSIWIKGRDFTTEKLLGPKIPADVRTRYAGGALGVFRLAPQDYHRFHIPVDGVMEQPAVYDGDYYTVNPMAIRSALDVYGENVRVICPIQSEAHGRVMVVCIGAMMVGSTVITRKAGEKVRRAEELGYFKFGGSTIVLLFEAGVLEFDEDIVANSKRPLETLLRVGMSVGHSPGMEPFAPDMLQENVTQEDREDAMRRIEGSLAPLSPKGPAGQ